MRPIDLDPDLDEWRKAYAAGASNGGGVSDEALAALILGELDPDEHQRVADLVAASPPAAARFRTMLALHRAASEPSRIPGPAHSTRTMLLAMAAMLVLAAGVASLWLVNRPRTSALRSGGDASAVTSPADGSTLDSPPTVLVWSPQVAAEAYQVSLFDAEADRIWMSPFVTVSRLELPASIAGELAPGHAYCWTVTVRGPVARSQLGPFWFTLAGERGGS